MVLRTELEVLRTTSVSDREDVAAPQTEGAKRAAPRSGRKYRGVEAIAEVESARDVLLSTCRADAVARAKRRREPGDGTRSTAGEARELHDEALARDGQNGVRPGSDAGRSGCR